MSKRDGGPAFPCAAFGPSDDAIFQEGLSLRDYFAGQAAQGAAAVHFSSGRYGCEELARRAYELADALLAQRDKEPS